MSAGAREQSCDPDPDARRVMLCERPGGAGSHTTHAGYVQYVFMAQKAMALCIL